MNYNGPRLAVQFFLKHAQKVGLRPQTARILDVGAGTGLVAQSVSDMSCILFLPVLLLAVNLKLINQTE